MVSFVRVLADVGYEKIIEQLREVPAAGNLKTDRLFILAVVMPVRLGDYDIRLDQDINAYFYVWLISDVYLHDTDSSSSTVSIRSMMREYTCSVAALSSR